MPGLEVGRATAARVPSRCNSSRSPPRGPAMASGGVPAADGNLLLNPGFEDGAPGEVGSLGRKAGGQGWTYLFAGASQAYLARVGLQRTPRLGLACVPRRTAAAANTRRRPRPHADLPRHGGPAPRTPEYGIRVGAARVDLRGKGFGTDASDSAVLQVEELMLPAKWLSSIPSRL